MITNDHLRTFFLWRWWVSLRQAIKRVRIHPNALLSGNVKRFRLGRGTKIGAGCRLIGLSSGQITTGERVWLARDVEIETSTKVYIGEGTTIQRRCTINGTTHIGAGCLLAPNVFISSGTHPFRETPWLPIRRQEQSIIAAEGNLNVLDRPVRIQDDCWLGVNAVICPGVLIGKGSIIGANAVVVEDVAPYTVVGGVPARLINHRLKWRPPNSISAENDEDQPYVLSGILKYADHHIPKGIKVTNEIPFKAILQIGSTQESISFELYSTLNVNVIVFGKTYHIMQGESELHVSFPKEKLEGSLLECNLLIGDENYRGLLLVRQVYCI